MRGATDAARRARTILLGEIGGIARFACGPAFSHVNIGNLREISLALLEASHRIEQEIIRRLDTYGCEAEGRRP
jgi:hypothetical protein